MEVIMMGKTIWRSIRVAALAAAVALALGSLAWGADDHDYYSRHDGAREHGYQNGYRDGQRQAQYDLQSGRRFKFKTDDWEDSRGFEHWMGSKGRYKQAYREGYERAYRQAFGYSGDRYRDRDRDDYHRYDRDWR